MKRRSTKNVIHKMTLFYISVFSRRMDYSDAIKYLRENDIKKDDGTYYEFGEVCPRDLRDL